MTIHLSSAIPGRSLAALPGKLVIFCVGQELRRVAAFRAWAPLHLLPAEHAVASMLIFQWISLERLLIAAHAMPLHFRNRTTGTVQFPGKSAGNGR